MKKPKHTCEVTILNIVINEAIIGSLNLLSKKCKGVSFVFCIFFSFYKKKKTIKTAINGNIAAA